MLPVYIIAVSSSPVSSFAEKAPPVVVAIQICLLRAKPIGPMIDYIHCHIGYLLLLKGLPYSETCLNATDSFQYSLEGKRNGGVELFESSRVWMSRFLDCCCESAGLSS